MTIRKQFDASRQKPTTSFFSFFFFNIEHHVQFCIPNTLSKETGEKKKESDFSHVLLFLEESELFDKRKKNA